MGDIDFWQLELPAGQSFKLELPKAKDDQGDQFVVEVNNAKSGGGGDTIS